MLKHVLQRAEEWNSFQLLEVEFNKKSIKLIVPGPMKTEMSYEYEKRSYSMEYGKCLNNNYFGLTLFFATALRAQLLLEDSDIK